MDIKQLSVPHRKVHRAYKDITLGIIHYTDSLSFGGTVSWFQDPKAGVSAHYVIGRQGQVAAFEGITTKLWHAGRSEWNEKRWCNGFSIGYELSGTQTSGFTHQQYDALVELIMDDLGHCAMEAIVGHEQVSPGRKIDPGPHFNWLLVEESIKNQCQSKNFKGSKLHQIGPHRLAHPTNWSPPKEIEYPVATIDINPEKKMESGKDPWWHFW